ncbi:MAG: hypothetical protein ABR867_04515 [Nitrososphaerales archaeon]
MSNWRDETRADLKDAEERLVVLGTEISGDLTEEQARSIWRAYLDVEKSVVFIKVEIDEENPGRFVNMKQYSVPDERQALQFALRNLRKGSESFALGDYRRSLRELREARNYLRLILRARRRIKTKAAKASRIR